jgi:hypothetical protein
MATLNKFIESQQTNTNSLLLKRQNSII